MSVHSHVSYGRDGSGQGPIHTFVIGFALRFVHCVSGAIVRLVLRQACVKPQGLLAAAPSAPARAWTAGNAGASSRQLDARPASALQAAPSRSSGSSAGADQSAGTDPRPASALQAAPSQSSGSSAGIRQAAGPDVRPASALQAAPSQSSGPEAGVQPCTGRAERPASASATVRAVMLTMRRTVAEAVSTCTGLAAPSSTGPMAMPPPAAALSRL